MAFEQQDRLAAFRAIVREQDKLLRLGYTVVATDDFDDIGRRLRECGRHKQAPMSSVSRNDYTQGRAFWLFLERDDRSVVGIGVALIDLGKRENLAQYIDRTSKGQYCRDTNPVARIKRVINAIDGRLVYVGDLTSSTDDRETSAAIRPLFTMIQLLCVDEWDFDWMYAYIPREKAKIGSIAQFYFKVDNAITWHNPVPEGRKNSHTLIATTPDHIADSFLIQ